MKLHTSDEQPKETLGKIVKCRFYESERHVMHYANEINWLRTGPKAPSEHGRIAAYEVVG